MKIEETKLYKTRGLKGVKRLLYFDYPLKFAVLTFLLYAIIFKMYERMLFFRIFFATLVLITIGIYIYSLILVIKFLRSEKNNV